DNPRTEASSEIIEHILAGIVAGADVQVEANRHKAIQLALESVHAGDLVLIAGKGHETYQEIMGVRHNFSDYEEVERYQKQYHGQRGA
ncbi:MAG: UDP-N-acetylmuramoyl-L-alanyl-D-glutamate--2,6-diaminopimelate ligase, partial [Planctomycetaceae bacterium]